MKLRIRSHLLNKSELLNIKLPFCAVYRRTAKGNIRNFSRQLFCRTIVKATAATALHKFFIKDFFSKFEERYS